MFMPLLHNIEKFNNTVIIQSSVLMYTDVYSVFFIQYNRVCDQACVTRSRTHVFMTPSIAHGQCLPCVCICQHPLQKSNKQGTCYTGSQNFKNTCNKNTDSKLHVIM